MMKKLWICCAAAAWLIFMSQTQLSAQIIQPTDPTKHWKIIETTHFEIIYAEEDRKLAEKFAAEAERADALLQPYLKTPMPNKVPLVIADITDTTNGAAMALPRSQIEVYPVLPIVSDPTSEYYDWHRELAQHEFTHILNFEPTSGFMSVLRFLFGTIVKPGGYLPRWYTEGLAVEMESRLTPLGRGRSLYYSALVRSMVDENLWGTEKIDQIGTVENPSWPRGQRPYTYGHFLLHQLSETPRLKGQHEGIYSYLDHRYGGRLPWFLDGPVEDYFGKTYEDLLQLTYNNLRYKARNQIAELKKSGAVNGVKDKQSGYFNFGTQFSPDGLKVASIVYDVDTSPEIKILTRPTIHDNFKADPKIDEKLTTQKDIHQLAWRGDSKTIVYDHSDQYKHFSNFSDLYEIGIEDHHEKRLTHGLRAREATVLADDSLVFVVASSHDTRLVHSDKKGENLRVLFTPPYGDRLSSPRAFGKGVIYSHRDTTGREWIESFDLDTGIPKKLTESPKVGDMSIMPVPDPENPKGFYFASSTTGVMNIYHDDGVSVRPVTNVISYAMSPAVDEKNNSLSYSRLTAKGFETEVAPIKPVPKIASVGRLEQFPKAQETEAPPAKIVKDKEYNGLKYMFPQYLLPFIYFVPGGALFQLSTANSDPLNHHQYAATIGYDTRASQPTEELSYTNGTFPFFIDVNLINDYVYLVGLGLTEHVSFGQIDTRHYLFPDTNKWVFGPEFIYQQTDYAPLSFQEFGPGASISWNNVAPMKDYQISPENGESLSLGYDYFFVPIQAFSSGTTSYGSVRGNGSLYLSGFLPEHHVLSLKGSAWVTPALSSVLVGSQQAGGEYLLSILPPYYLVRGYPVGEFIGWQMYVANLEYRFPLFNQWRGWGNFPLFFKRWHGALVGDGITLKGGYYDNGGPNVVLLGTGLQTPYFGAGGELRSDITVAYGFDMTMRLGAYYGFDLNAYGGWSYMLSFGTVQ
jgi:hypothetical protein